MPDQNNEQDLRIRSKVISEGVNRVPNRAMLRAVGFTDESFKKPMIGVASTWSEVTPCNIHINNLAVQVKNGAQSNDGSPLIFNTITVSDGIAWVMKGCVSPCRAGRLLPIPLKLSPMRNDSTDLSPLAAVTKIRPHA